MQKSANKTEFRAAEIWKPVPSEPGVLASSLGRILLPPIHIPMPRGGYRTCVTQPRTGCLKTYANTTATAYRVVTVSRGRGRENQFVRYVHQLVCEAFHGPKPFPKAVAMHKDEDSMNNTESNLEWGTQKQNLNAPGFIEYCKSRLGKNSPSAKHAAKKARQGDASRPAIPNPDHPDHKDPS